MLHKTLDTTKRALNRYYANEKGWPSSLKTLESKGYLPKNYIAPLGSLSYADNGNTLILTLTLPAGSESAKVATRVASLSGGQANGSNIVLKMAPSVGFIDENMYIDRLNPKAMATDINLNSKWVKNGDLQGGTIDVTQAKGNALAVSRDATVARNVLVAGQLTGTEANLAKTAYQNNVNAHSITTNEAAVVNGKTVAATANLKSTSTFHDSATVNEATTANGPVKVSNSISIDGSTTFNNATNFQSMTLSNMLTAAGGITGTQATFQQGLIDQVQAKDLTANDVSVTGKVSAKDVRAQNVYAVNGEFSGNLTTQGLATKNAVQANNGLYVGTDNVMVADKDGNLYQRGKRLDQVYLGKDAKAADSALLDGMSANELSVLAQDRTFTGRNSFNGLVQFNSIGYAGGKKFIEPATGQLSEAGQTLDSRYLGINAKAADTALLDGLAASAFGQLAAENVFSQRATFNQGLQVNGNLLSGGTMVASNGQWFEGGQALSLRYLGIHGKAADTALLDGVSSEQLARRDTNNVFTGSNTFSQDVTVGGQVLLGSVRAVESRTGSLEGRVASTNSQLDNLLYIKSRCKVHAKDPGCQFVFVPKPPVEVPTHTWGLYTTDYGSGQATIHMRSGWANALLFGSVSPGLASSIYGLEIIWSIAPPNGRVCVRSGKLSYPGGSYCKGRPLSSLKLLSTGQTFYFGDTAEHQYCSYCSSTQNIPIQIKYKDIVYEPIILK
ncbi:hypothetical protein [Aeromonas hydrophila]|uniref:hypothetical protein n=1 Tax=Aeromonas hydrophila TaxID=644 RepID=UPI002B480F24|nr:hypothetical protein [Aeromonas hydrophila]